MKGNQPPPENEQFPNGEKRPKDRLVVSGQPKRQVEVKVVDAILSVTACQTSSDWAFTRNPSLEDISNGWATLSGFLIKSAVE